MKRRQKKSSWVQAILLISLLFAGQGYAQKPQSPAPPPPRTVTALFTELPIRIDGQLDEEIWQKAAPARDFVQIHPNGGNPASEPTEVRVLFDLENIYFGVICHQSTPLVVSELRQDFDVEGNDTFAVVIDTFNDRRNGFIFITNPAGAKRDLQFVEEGRDEDEQWDGVWRVATRKAADGWVCEIAISLRSVRFPTDSQPVWGINFNRRVRNKNEITYWSPIPERYARQNLGSSSVKLALTRVSFAGQLLGLESIEQGHRIRVKPYVKSEIRNGGGQDTDFRLDSGLNARYSLTDGMILDLAARPDFSEVEVDTQQINLTRFNVFFPEKREFFLENSGIFHFGDEPQIFGPLPERYTRLFYSRKIGLTDNGLPITIFGGARLSGRTGPFSLGLLNIQTRESGAVPSNNFTVARAKGNILANSDVGAIFIDREGGNSNRTLGVDANFQFFRKLNVMSYLAKTDTPGRKGKEWAGKISGTWSDDFMQLQGYHGDFGENFNPEVGFVPRKGVEIDRVSVSLFPRPRNSRFIRYIRPHALYYAFTDQNGRLLSRETHYGFIEIHFRNGAEMEVAWAPMFERLREPFGRIVKTPPGDYHFHDNILTFTSDRSRRISTDLRLNWGPYYDGRKKTLRAQLRLQPDEHLTANMGYTVNDVDLKNGSFVTHLAGWNVSWAINTRTYLDAFIQYNSERKSFTSNLRFRFIHRPLSDMIIVYTEERGNSASQGTNNSLLLKYTHLLQF